MSKEFDNRAQKEDHLCSTDTVLFGAALAVDEVQSRPRIPH